MDTSAAGAEGVRPPKQLRSRDGTTLKLLNKQQDWSDNSLVLFHFGTKASCAAGGQINPYNRRERIVFIPPIPPEVWKVRCRLLLIFSACSALLCAQSAVEYVRSIANKYMQIKPLITAEVVVSTDPTARQPVFGVYTYPQEVPTLLEGPTVKTDKKDDADDKDDVRLLCWDSSAIVDIAH